MIDCLAGNFRHKMLPLSTVLVQQLRFKNQKRQRYKAPPPPKEKDAFIRRKR